MVLELVLAGGTIVTGILARRRAKIEAPIEVVEQPIIEPPISTEDRPEIKRPTDPKILNPTDPVTSIVTTVSPTPQKKIDLLPTIAPPKIVSVTTVVESKTPEQKRVDAGIYEGKLIKATGDTKTYFVKNGQKLWIISSSNVRGYEGQYGKTVEVSKEVIFAIPSGPSISSALSVPGEQPKPIVEVKVSSQTLSVKEVQNVIPTSVATVIKTNQSIINQGGVIPQKTVAIITAPVATATGTKVMKVAEVTNTGKILEV